MENFIEQIDKRRTFAIISHPDAGKTTLTEKLLLYGGAIQQAGIVKGKKGARAAVSDWMEIEKQRGISVTSSVLQFRYNGYCVNILDTPGHQDFSEDTYRTLMAADSAVMVIDAAKGVENQTKKLFKVCTMRGIPIFTFINKMDRDAQNPFDLLEEIEQVLGIETYPMNWPIGSGKEFKGVYDRNKKEILAFQHSGKVGQQQAEKIEAQLGDPGLDELLTKPLHDTLSEDIELLDGAAYEFNLDKVRHGMLTPVFFGSALTNFGVEPFLADFLRLSPPPLPRDSSAGPIDPRREDFSAFVFKIQANMNKAHRDRIAFIRICSGKFERGMDVFHVQGGKKVKLAQGTQLMASEREIVEEAYAGDIIGVFDPGIFSIGAYHSQNAVCFRRYSHLCAGAFFPRLPSGHHEAQAVCEGYGTNCPGGRHPDLQGAGRRHGRGHRRRGGRTAVRGAGVPPQERIQCGYPHAEPAVQLYPVDRERGLRPQGAESYQ